MTQISLDKQYQTRDGEEVELVSMQPGLDGECTYPILGYIKRKTGQIFTSAWKSDGTWASGPSSNDLVEVPKKYTHWLNVYPSGQMFTYPSKRQADLGAGSDRIACIETTYTKGEGL